jgi:hypothetical protein
MQTITSNQERTVLAAKDIADNFIESQRQVTNSLQTAGSPSLIITFGALQNK